MCALILESRYGTYTVHIERLQKNARFWITTDRGRGYDLSCFTEPGLIFSSAPLDKGPQTNLPHRGNFFYHHDKHNIYKIVFNSRTFYWSSDFEKGNGE